MRHGSGEYRWVISRAKGRFDEQGRLQRLIGLELDITERKVYEEALFREKESAQITLQAIGDGVITTDADSIIDYINPVAENLTGWRLEDAMGRNVDEVFRAFHEETCEPLENPLTGSIRRVRPMKSGRPMLMIRRDGNELYVESTAAPIRDGVGKVVGAVLVFHDVSESRELNRKLSYHASHDALTGLVNRREFESRIERGLKSARAEEGSYALCHIDLDQFKMINDSCGHAAGDQLLGQIGALLKSKIRWRDTLSRLGGDEYGVLLESSSLEDALRTAEVMREAVKNFRFEWEDRVFKLSVSVGVVPITADNEDVASILSAAEGACAAAKEQGRNRVHSFAENDIELMRRRRETQWAARISAALDDGRFELYRMPIMALKHKEEGEHYEILVRMRDEQGKIISPDHFIAAAERYNITPAIDRWVIENTFRWLVSEADERERLLMCAINLSGQSLGDDKFLPFIIEQFQKSGLDASKICFEITETSAVASFSQANRFIRSLKELGCKFSLDDFGTGMSSFNYLKQFPVDYLKIDGSFVRGILNDPDRPRDGALDQRDRPPDRQAGDRGIRREPGNHRDAAPAGRGLRAGLRHRAAQPAGQEPASRRLSYADPGPGFGPHFGSAILNPILASWQLLLGMGVLMLGAGLQGTLLGVRATLEGFPAPVIGVVMSCYYVGYLVGTKVTPVFRRPRRPRARVRRLHGSRVRDHPAALGTGRSLVLGR